MGYAQSAWAGTFNGGDSNDGTSPTTASIMATSNRQLIQYNFGSGEGFFATVSLENDPGSGNYSPTSSARSAMRPRGARSTPSLANDEDIFDTGGAGFSAMPSPSGSAATSISARSSAETARLLQ